MSYNQTEFRVLGKAPSANRASLATLIAALITAALWGNVAAASDLYDAPRDNEVYFAHDSATIPASYDSALAKHGRRLAANPHVSVRIEGHADLRGSREYNLRLGEQRAQAVRQVLIRYGAAPEQFTAVSFGEEFRAHSSDLARNRRVVIAYDNQPAPPR